MSSRLPVIPKVGTRVYGIGVTTGARYVGAIVVRYYYDRDLGTYVTKLRQDNDKPALVRTDSLRTTIQPVWV